MGEEVQITLFQRRETSSRSPRQNRKFRTSNQFFRKINASPCGQVRTSRKKSSIFDCRITVGGRTQNNWKVVPGVRGESKWGIEGERLERKSDWGAEENYWRVGEPNIVTKKIVRWEYEESGRILGSFVVRTQKSILETAMIFSSFLNYQESFIMELKKSSIVYYFI